MAKLAIYQLTLSSNPMGQLRGEKWISNQPRLKGKSNRLNWMNGGRRATTAPSSTRSG